MLIKPPASRGIIGPGMQPAHTSPKGHRAVTRCEPRHTAGRAWEVAERSPASGPPGAGRRRCRRRRRSMQGCAGEGQLLHARVVDHFEAAFGQGVDDAPHR
jgi:hypothetical protein